MNNKTCIVIVGPTAVGKTNLSLELARKFKTSIISADSRQCFIELNIGVAKPSPEQLAAVHHYFINSHHIYEEVNAAIFERLSLDWCQKIFEKNDKAIMVGGTGLYVKAFSQGLDEVPPSSPEIRKKIVEGYHSNGIEWLQQQIKQVDPVFFDKGEIHNPQRVMRALEVMLASGQTILSFQASRKKERPFDIIKIGLDLPRDILYQRINQRVDEMIATGLEEEARSLIKYRHLNSLQTVGYKEFFDYFDGRINLEKCIELIRQNTRHYAKRQLTWFRKDEEIHWFDGSETTACIEFIHK